MLKYFEMYIQKIDTINSVNAMDILFEKIAEDDNLSNDEYSLLYEYALDKFRE